MAVSVPSLRLGGWSMPSVLLVLQIPDDTAPKPGLKRSTVPRFCDEVRHQRPHYAKLFRRVFVNKTFLLYKVMKP